MFCQTLFGKHDYFVITDRTHPVTWWDGYGYPHYDNSIIRVKKCKKCGKVTGAVFRSDGWDRDKLTKSEINYLI